MKKKSGIEKPGIAFNYEFEFEINGRKYRIEKKITKKELSENITINEDMTLTKQDSKILHRQLLKIEKQGNPVNCMISATIKKLPAGISYIRILPCKLEM